MDLTHSYVEYQKITEHRLYAEGVVAAVLKNTDDLDFIPTRKFPSDAGADCRARIYEPITLMPRTRATIPLGFAVNVPSGFSGDLRPRSGLARDHGVQVFYGTIDAGYTGEVCATIINLGNDPFVIVPKMRIAQFVIVQLATDYKGKLPEFVVIDKLEEIERGDNGHGSTGTN